MMCASVYRLYCMIRYDTVDLRALKSWRDGQLNLAHGPVTKNNENNKNKNRVAQKKRCRQKSVEAVRDEEVRLREVGFVKEVGFKPGVKERWSYRCIKWWIRRGRSDGWRNRWAGDGGTGARMRFTVLYSDSMAWIDVLQAVQWTRGLTSRHSKSQGTKRRQKTRCSPRLQTSPPVPPPRRNINFDSGPFASVCEKMTSSTKPEVHNVFHCRQRRSDAMSNMCRKFGPDRQTCRHADRNMFLTTACPAGYMLCLR